MFGGGSGVGEDGGEPMIFGVAAVEFWLGCVLVDEEGMELRKELTSRRG